MIRFTLAVLSVCTLSWTITQEEIFKEFREWLKQKDLSLREYPGVWCRSKLSYMATCHYCMSFWITVGYSYFNPLPRSWILPVIWIANVVMTAYGLLRQQQKKCSLEAKHHERRLAA